MNSQQLTEITDPQQFPEPARRALADFLLALADTKRFLGLRYAEWSAGAPTLEASIAAAAMAQDELGHSRALAPMLKDFAQVDPAIPDEAPRARYANIAFLDEQFPDWNTFVAANVLLGTATTIALQAARESSFTPLKTRAGKILEEERFHWLHGEAWFKRLAKDEKTMFDLGAIADEMLPQALCWFGRAEGELLAREKILDADAEMLRARYVHHVAPLLSQSASAHWLTIEKGQWNYRGGMPWARYDAATRRVERVGRG